MHRIKQGVIAILVEMISLSTVKTLYRRLRLLSRGLWRIIIINVCR